MKVDIYLVPFLSSYAGYDKSTCGKAYKALSEALACGDWPYDVGDDPSFFSERQIGGNLTWGICRPQVRNRIKPGDMVVFFSCRRRKETDPFEYCLCALATVEQKIRHSDLWSNPELRVYQRYLNLLIKPISEGCWQHDEPGSENDHEDWLWRIVEHAPHLRKRDYEALESKGVVRESSRVRGIPISFAKNYVLFSKEERKSFIVPKPPVIALCYENGNLEEWHNDTFSQTIKKLTVDLAMRHGRNRHLRSTHKQHAHPHIRLPMDSSDAEGWRCELLKAMREFVSH